MGIQEHPGTHPNARKAARKEFSFSYTMYTVKCRSHQNSCAVAAAAINQALNYLTAGQVG